MRVRVVVELEVGESPVADAISYFVARNGVTDGDDSRNAPEWIEAVVIDSIERSIEDTYAACGAEWVIRRTTVSREP